jgi:nitrate/nitrite transport system substrate-binding protein
MGIFDDPFDANHSLRNGSCSCGNHANQGEHERAVQNMAQCTATASEPGRYESVVAAALMRAIFPQDVARRHS